ncbi:MAG TPA: tetratricopeptide repeat protein [Bryobacteraceae bacterium]|nr:tetratricopeptide repeat protein [Bryobacteraceae bacterium]
MLSIVGRSAAVFLLSLTALAQTDPPNSAAVFLGKGNQLVERRLFLEAAGEFQKALEIEPGLDAARYQLAICFFALGQNDDSRRQFELLKKKQAGSSHEVSYYLGRILLLSGDSAGAIRELAAITKDPKIPDADYFLGLAYLDAGDQKLGIQWLEHAAQARPRDYHVHYRLARVYAGAGRKADADREYGLYNKYRNGERSTEDKMRACSSALDSKAADKIQEACAHLVDQNDPEKLELLAEIYGAHGHFADAVEPLTRAVRLDPGSYDAWHNLGLSYFRLKRYQEARQPLEKAAALRPDIFDTLNLLGATLYVLGDDKAALPVLERAHQLRPDDAQLKAALDQLRK